MNSFRLAMFLRLFGVPVTIPEVYASDCTEIRPMRRPKCEMLRLISIKYATWFAYSAIVILPLSPIV